MTLYASFSEEVHQENDWLDPVSPAETEQDSKLLVIELTGSPTPENTPKNKEQCDSGNQLGRADLFETQNGFAGVKSLSHQYDERELQPICDLNRNCKDQATMTIKVENVIECSELTVPAESEERSSEDAFDKTYPKDLIEGEHNVSPVCEGSGVSSNSVQPLQSLISPDGCQRAYTGKCRDQWCYQLAAMHPMHVMCCKIQIKRDLLQVTLQSFNMCKKIISYHSRV
ncbi:uncharacterized protein LOC119953107 [Scyliorhinus canicula]|uniref:uncharacterized protein LOC119953107 n=1 Tax=Scyliorhinus canicula TaxID=7830 RepID=UPI0018F2FAB3|nr:uncharacterized protein LOC119953107 [Scyliorhinus canicula]XP_038632885.1 uncharacterized protein LOC119953107 [Scyliorhinus canicula]